MDHLDRIALDFRFGSTHEGTKRAVQALMRAKRGGIAKNARTFLSDFEAYTMISVSPSNDGTQLFANIESEDSVLRNCQVEVSQTDEYWLSVLGWKRREDPDQPYYWQRQGRCTPKGLEIFAGRLTFAAFYAFPGAHLNEIEWVVACDTPPGRQPTTLPNPHEAEEAETMRKLLTKMFGGSQDAP